MPGDTYPRFRAAAVQAAPVYLDRDATVDKAIRLIDTAAAAGAELVVFPEVWIAAYPVWTLVYAPMDNHHLLLTDVVMPNRSGRELAEQLTPRRPELRVLYMSGYTDDAVIRYGLQADTIALLRKPFSPRALEQQVRAMLDGPPRP